MYLDHFGLAEPPFRITPHTEFFFSGASRGATLDALVYAATHDEGIIKISGEVGSGKTMLCRVLMERLPENVAIVYLCNPSLSRDDILYAIADELEVALPENARPNATLKSLQNHLIGLYAAGKRVVLLIDEAHAMPAETLEEIRLLSNLESNQHKLLQLVLFGQPELNDVLARADMRQLKERITHNFSLEPLTRDDVADYLEFRMRTAGYKGPNLFGTAVSRLIYGASAGLSRRINILADKSLLAAFAAGTHQITTKEVRAAIGDCNFSSTTQVRRHLQKWLFGAALATGAAALGAMAAIYLPPTLDSHASMASSAPTPPPASPIRAPADAEFRPSIAGKPAAKVASRTEQALERGRIWLDGAADHRWFLQLYAADATDTDKIETYLRRFENAEMDAVHVYRSDLSGKLRLGVTYGDYETRSAALVAAKQLPKWVQAAHPYPRQVRRLR